MKKLLVITPISHIRGLKEKLASHFELLENSDPLFDDVSDVLGEVDGVFTNPNKSKLPINKRFMGAARNLKFITTASTGLIHIDLDEAARRSIKVISLTKELPTIEKISSTAEHALALTLSALRKVLWSNKDVLEKNWDYEKFIGRQFDQLTVGVVGWGRLGKMYSRYADALGAKVLVCDPKYNQEQCPHNMTDLDNLVQSSDVIALHIHATPENINLFDEQLLRTCKSDVLIVNTSRGEIVDEGAMVGFLESNPKAMLATDVLADELTDKWSSPLFKLAEVGGNVLITPHIGGMTKEAQEIAYHRVADMLIEFDS